MFRRVQVRHYKLLRNIDITLDSMNILVGPNASGKSTLLDVFSFLQDALIDDVETAVRSRSRSLHELVWMQQDVVSGFEIAIEMDIPLHLVSEKHTTVRYELNVGLNDEGSLAIRAENLFLKPRRATAVSSPAMQMFPHDDHTDRPIFVAPRAKAPSEDRPIFKKSSEGNSNFRSEKTDWTTVFRFAPLKLTLASMPEDETRFPVGLWFKNALLQNLQILQLNSALMRRTTPSDARRTFQTDGSNLPIVVADLRANHPLQFQWWIAHVQTILPDLTDVRVEERPEDRSRYLSVVYGGGLPVPSWLLSDGTLRLLALTLIAYLPDESRVFMIEEPENGVHPKAIEGIFASLKSVYDGQIFMATHSPLLLGLASPEQLLIFAKTETGASAIVRGAQHPLLSTWQRDLSLGNLFASGVLG
jgi:predicted ATPase